MRNKILKSSSILISLCASSAMADELIMIPRIEIGLQNYENVFTYKTLDNNREITETNAYKYQSDVVAAGLTLAYSGFYFDMDVKTVLNNPIYTDDYEYNDSSYNLENYDEYYVENSYYSYEYSNYKDEFSRLDLSGTVGYGFGAFSLFAGYKYGNSTYDYRTEGFEWERNSSNDIDFLYTHNEEISELYITTKGEYETNSSGPFFGISHSLSLGDYDVIALSLAYAMLDISKTNSYTYQTSGVISSIVDFAGQPDTQINETNSDNWKQEDISGSGLAFSVKWSHYLDSGNSLFIKFDTQNYEYDLENDDSYTEQEIYSRLTFGFTL